MKNYQAVHQWTATLNVDAAVHELETAMLKYPWLKCQEALTTLQKMQKQLPDVIKIIKLQEKQNAIHREFVGVSRIADVAIVEGIKSQYNIE